MLIRAFVKSNGRIVDARATDILVANNDLRRKGAPRRRSKGERLLTRCHGNGF
jgi:hypothetical protein